MPPRSTQQLAGGYQAWFEKRLEEIEAALDSHAEAVTDEMKSQAPWQDVTGDARRSLKARSEVRRRSNGAEIIFTLLYDDPNVTYGDALENGRAGKYSIIRPTAAILRRALPAFVAGRLGR